MALVAVLLSLSLFHSNTGLAKYRRLKGENEKLVEINRHLRAETAEFAAEARALENDDEYIEKIARDRMGMAREDEVIIKLRK